MRLRALNMEEFLQIEFSEEEKERSRRIVRAQREGRIFPSYVESVLLEDVGEDYVFEDDARWY